MSPKYEPSSEQLHIPAKFFPQIRTCTERYKVTRGPRALRSLSKLHETYLTRNWTLFRVVYKLGHVPPGNPGTTCRVAFYAGECVAQLDAQTRVTRLITLVAGLITLPPRQRESGTASPPELHDSIESTHPTLTTANLHINPNH